MTRALVVGNGSIGQRHMRVLAGLGCEVAVVSRRALQGEPRTYTSIDAALHDYEPGYVVLARETAAHGPDVVTLADLGFQGLVLVEKPLSSVPLELPTTGFARFAVGYNLRFHPVINRLRHVLEDEQAATADVYAGQHLSSWRAQGNYRSGYSASPEGGGGVLRDLSHELDYLQWLFGPWRRVCAHGGRTGTLDIRSDDCWAILLVLDGCPVVSVQLNYLDWISQRTITINTHSRTLHADLRGSSLNLNGVTEHLPVEPDLTYRRQHEAMLFGRDSALLCSATDGHRVTQLIDAVEQSAERQEWVTR